MVSCETESLVCPLQQTKMDQGGLLDWRLSLFLQHQADPQRKKKHHIYCYYISKHSCIWPGIICLIGGIYWCIGTYCGQLSCDVYWTNSWLIDDQDVGGYMKVALDFGKIWYQLQPICITSNSVHRVSVDRFLTTKGKAFGRKLEKKVVQAMLIVDWYTTDTLTTDSSLIQCTFLALLMIVIATNQYSIDSKVPLGRYIYWLLTDILVTFDQYNDWYVNQKLTQISVARCTLVTTPYMTHDPWPAITYKVIYHYEIFLKMNLQITWLLMNDFPVIGDLVLRTGLWDHQGANIASYYKVLYGVELFLH